MNTQAHVLLAAALLARPDRPRRMVALVAGALVPDVIIFWMVFWERFANGLTFRQIFEEAYFSGYWQTFFAVPNSIIVYALGAVAALVLRLELLWVFCAAALVHVVLDLPLHHDDGHPHFWPVTNWIFESPVSYWDPRHHGGIAGLAELGLCIGLAVILWRRFTGTAARIIIGALLVLEALFTLGGFFFAG